MTLLAALPPDSSRRRAVFTSVAILLALVLTQVLPKPAPAGVLFGGLLVGCVNALLATGLVLVYRSARVVNFAQAALGAGGGYLVFVLSGLLGWPLLVSIPLGLICAAALGALVDLFLLQRFFSSPRLVLTVVTIVLASLLGRTSSWVDKIPAVADAKKSLANVDRITSGRVESPFPGLDFEMFPFHYGFPAVLTLIATVTVFVLLAVFLRYSRFGVAMRGAAENSDRALLLGINVRLLSTLVWTIAGALSGLAAILLGLTEGFALVGDPRPQLLIPALAAAVIARMSSLPVAVAAAVTISAVQASVLWAFPRTAILDLVLLVVIAGGLLTQRARGGRSEKAAESWSATRELRPTPAELLVVPVVRRTRHAMMALALLGVVVFPFASSQSQTNLGGLIAIQAIVALSLVVLTGWAGQVSLGQFAFVAVAAVVAGKLTGDIGVSFWLVLPLVAALTAAFAALVGFTALRLSGAFLAVTTLAFAVAVQSTLFNEEYFGWLQSDRIERPRLVFVSLASERNYYFLCVGMLVLCAVVVTRLRASRPGRVLIGLRDNEAGVESFGVNAVRTRLAAFALSGALAGIAGVLFVHHQRTIDAGSFSADVSVAIFIMAMIGGITSVSGALLGATYLGLANFLFADPLFRDLAGSGGLLLLLLVAPGGLAAVAYGARDSMLRVVASRNRIPVPSLFAGKDPEAAWGRRAPLAEPLDTAGLCVIPRSRRYRLRSELYARPVKPEAGA